MEGILNYQTATFLPLKACPIMKFMTQGLMLLSCFALNAPAQNKLLIFAGAASRPPTEEVAALFEKETAAKVEIVFGGSGYILSQMRLAKQGDIYFPGSSDYMEKAKKEGNVLPETEKVVVYLVPCINVQKGNPRNISALKDLTNPGLKVAIANPEGVCVGVYAVEIIEKQFSSEEKAALKKNLINYTGSCEQTAAAISLKQADAVIGWHVFEYWNPELIETIQLNADQIPRIGYIPIAVSRFTKNRALAQRFIDFMLSPESQAVFKKYHYFATPQEAADWIGAEKRVGGEYAVPADWLRK
jgi:molybdate transport system substrate-binding protein